MYQNGYINQLSAIRRIYESQRFISGSAKEFITYTKLFFFLMNINKLNQKHALTKELIFELICASRLS